MPSAQLSWAGLDVCELPAASGAWAGNRLGSKHQIKVANETMDCDKIIEEVQREKRGRTKHRNLGTDRPSGTLESHWKERC